MSHKKDFFDLQDDGSKILRKDALLIVGSEYVFMTTLASELGRPDYSVRRYLDHLTRELLLDNFDELEQAIANVLRKCSDGTISSGINPEKVMRRCERFEKKFAQELREIHEKAVQRYIG